MNDWFWKIYAVFFILVALGRASYFFDPQQEPMLYYSIMTRFHTGYYLPFSLEICSQVLTLVSCVPIFLFAFNVERLMPLWRRLFYVRIFTDLCGHHYVFKSIQSGFGDSAFLGFLTIAALIFPIIPSYIAHFTYAFKRRSPSRWNVKSVLNNKPCNC